MSVYDRAAASAKRLLAKYGRVCTLTQKGGGSYNTATRQVTPASTSSTTRQCALFDYGAGVTDVRGQLVRVGDKRCLMEAGVAPGMNDLLDDGAGTQYSMVSIGEINPGGTVVVYDLHVRAA